MTDTSIPSSLSLSFDRPANSYRQSMYVFSWGARSSTPGVILFTLSRGKNTLDLMAMHCLQQPRMLIGFCVQGHIVSSFFSCDTSLDSCWCISPPCQGPPQSSTTPRFQLFAKLFASSSKLLIKLLNNTGSCTNLWSTPLVTGFCASHWNSLCWSQPFDPSRSAISFQFVIENVMGVCSESLAELRINNIHYCPLIFKPLISFKRLLG